VMFLAHCTQPAGILARRIFHSWVYLCLHRL
jgi:hypothetical protein